MCKHAVKILPFIIRYVPDECKSQEMYNKWKQPLRGVLQKRCSENMQQIYRRHPCRSVISIKLLCNLCELRQFFLSDFLSTNCANTPKHFQFSLLESP